MYENARRPSFEEETRGICRKVGRYLLAILMVFFKKEFKMLKCIKLKYMDKLVDHQQILTVN